MTALMSRDAVTSPTCGTIWFRTGPPRLLRGLRVRGRVARYGVLLPPAGGPARAAALHAKGTALLDDARRDYGRVLRQVLTVAGSDVPPPVDLAVPWPLGPARAVVDLRRGAWAQTRERLEGASGVDLADLERRGRAALDAAVDAFDHLEDTELAGKAHAQAHAVGEMVAGLFGCRAERDGDRWFDVCRLSLMHLRLGLSPSFDAPRYCSICGGDIADVDCDHDPGRTYSVVAARDTDDSCTVCGEAECLDHVPGAVYATVPDGVIREADLEEISVVPRPRDPLARLDGIELSAQAVAAMPGSDRRNAVLHCERCTSPCTGFTSAEEALGLL